MGGTRRFYPEVKAAMQKEGNKGWQKFLDLVDKGYSFRVAQLGHMAGATVFGRVSAQSANANTKGDGWAAYSRIQGQADDLVSAVPYPGGVVVVRPGVLNRGDISDMGASGGGSDPKGLPVSTVAKRLLENMDKRLERKEPGVTIVEPVPKL